MFDMYDVWLNTKLEETFDMYDVAPTGEEEAAEHAEACVARHGSGSEAR
jgi:hypothetical protein